MLLSAQQALPMVHFLQHNMTCNLCSCSLWRILSRVHSWLPRSSTQFLMSTFRRHSRSCSLYTCMSLKRVSGKYRIFTCNTRYQGCISHLCSSSCNLYKYGLYYTFKHRVNFNKSYLWCSRPF